MAPRMADQPQRLDTLVERLERAAVALRAGDLPPDRAAALVDECARAAADAAAELDRRLRASEAAAAPPGQLALDS
jgi:hypothetical protein